MFHNFWFWDSDISRDVCDRIIFEHKDDVEDGVVYAKDGSEETVIRRSTRRSKVSFNVSDEARDLCLYYTHAANRAAFGVDLANTIDCQFTMYEGGDNGFYRWHMDWAATTSSAFDRKLSCIIVLSDPDDYEGGELQLGYDTDPIKPPKGSVYVFPSFLMHQVNPVTSGERFTLVSWAEGAKWR